VVVQNSALQIIVYLSLGLLLFGLLFLLGFYLADLLLVLVPGGGLTLRPPFYWVIAYVKGYG
jgi:hypothetical protein